MSRTDKDAPFRIRQERGEVSCDRSMWRHTETGWRKQRKSLKRMASRKRRRTQSEKIDYRMQIAYVHWLN